MLGLKGAARLCRSELVVSNPIDQVVGTLSPVGGKRTIS